MLPLTVLLAQPQKFLVKIKLSLIASVYFHALNNVTEKIMKSFRSKSGNQNLSVKIKLVINEC